MKFTLLKQDRESKARLGEIETAHGKIKTPIFMPVGTTGSIKGVHQHELIEDTLAQIILGNTYHLYLRPGLDIIESAGGLHKFIGWDKPLFQLGVAPFLLAELFKISLLTLLTKKIIKFRKDGSMGNYCKKISS